jgi:hypothetical protein
MSAHDPAGDELSEGAQDLIERVVSSKRPVVFLLGSALTMQPGPGLAGVPDVRGVVAKLREALSGKGGARFDEALARAEGSGLGKDFNAAYQEGFAALLRRGEGQDGVNRVIREAVLEAHEILDDERRARVLDGHPAEHRKACEDLLRSVDGWRPLRPSVAALGEILRQDPTKFGHVLTTNFDPLIEVAVKRAGGEVRRSVIGRDGNPEQHGGDGTHVVYVHGYWFGTDTLHTDVQLRKPRPQLQATLKRRIEPSLLVVLGYGGWDDVLMASLSALTSDEGAFPDIVWGFYGQQDPEVMGKLEAAGGRAQPYEHVDMHRLLPRLRDRLVEKRNSVPLPRQPAWLEAPYQDLPVGDRSIPGFRLLRAEHGVVRMAGREAMLEEFAAWCEQPGLAIRLVTAPGGHGKTRLLRELCKQWIAQGWTAGLLRRSADHAGLLGTANAGRPMLLAIDYAETWGTSSRRFSVSWRPIVRAAYRFE